MVVELILLIAQLPVPDEVWKLALNQGFSAFLVLVLLAILYTWKKDEAASRERLFKRLELLTRSHTDVVLAMAFLPRQFHDSAREVRRELEEDDSK